MMLRVKAVGLHEVGSLAANSKRQEQEERHTLPAQIGVRHLNSCHGHPGRPMIVV
jgi:hypothetical protein